MVSVKRFIHDEPLLFKASKAFVALLFRCADPIVYVACRLPDRNAQIAWTLLGSALFQDRTYPDILRLLVKLYERFPGDKLWTLPVPKAGEIEEVVEQTFNSRNWPVFEHVAGIFWSVGLFVRRHPDLVAWVREHSPEEMWNDLGDIYFMGRSNPRPKACATIYRPYLGPLRNSIFQNSNRKKNRNLPTNILRRWLPRIRILRHTPCSSFSKTDRTVSFAVS